MVYATAEPPLDESGSSSGKAGAQPRMFGDYALLEKIGQGGMGVVYRAFDQRLNREVALKMLSANLGVSPVSLARFRLEAQLAAKLEHPNIVSTHEVGEVGGAPYFTMGLVEGTHLRHQMSRWTLVPSAISKNSKPPTASSPVLAAQVRIARLVATLARAISHAHDRGVVHRDLKPSNIIIDAEDRPHVTDFGIAKLLTEQHELTGTDDILGTPNYMSPEQAQGGSVGPLSDVYSLGAILYELLTGRPPFRAATAVETLRLLTTEQLTHPAVANRGVDADLATICAKCLEKNPSHRYSSALLLAEDLEHWIRREPILARPASPWMRLRRWGQRNPVGAALILTLLIGFGVSLWLLRLVSQERDTQVQLRAEIQREKRASDGYLARTILMVRESLERLWSDGEKRFFILSSEDLAALSSRSVSSMQLGGVPLRLKMGITVQQSPVSDQEHYAVLLGYLEERMAAVLKRTVLLDLHFFKFVEDKNNAIAEGRVDLTLMGAFPYLMEQQRHRGQGLRGLIVASNSTRVATFFAHRGSGIRNYGDFRGHSVAFGDTNSTTSFTAQLHLAKAGITSETLSKYAFLDSTLEFIDDVKAVGQEEAVRRIGYLNSHAEVLEAVASGKYDLGVAQTRAFQMFGNTNLVAIGEPILVPRRIWAARGKLDREIAEAFVTAMLSFGSQTWMQALEDTPESFVRFEEEMLQEERQWLDRAALAFPVAKAVHNGTRKEGNIR